jgi:hypothetical protein
MIALTNRLGRGAVFALAATSAACAASVSFAATSSGALPRYDGIWSVLIVTEKGDCDRGYRYPIRIAHGLLVNAGDAAFTITGKVAPTGMIRVTVSHGSSSASGSGRLAGDTGTGAWIGGSCSGTWTAERRGR